MKSVINGFRLALVYALMGFALLYWFGVFTPLMVVTMIAFFIMAIAGEGAERLWRRFSQSQLAAAIRMFIVLGILQWAWYVAQQIGLVWTFRRVRRFAINTALKWRAITRFIGLATLLFFAVGCEGLYYTMPIGLPRVTVTTNPAYRNLTLSVENVHPSTLMSVKLNGVLVKTDIPVGGNWVVRAGNLFSPYTAQFAVTTIFIDQAGNYLGTASKTFYVSGYSQDAQVWAPTNWDIQR